MEHKLDNTVKALSNIEGTIANVDAILQMKNNQIPHNGLLNEFTTRGVLSSIKTVEKKLDRLLLVNQNKYFKSIDNSNAKPKLQIKCTAPKFVEDLLNDISSKVDVIFDNFSDKQKFTDDTEDESDYLDITEGSGQSTNKQPNANPLQKVLRKVMQSCKQTDQALEEILTRNIRAENILLEILDKEHIILDSLNKEIRLRKNLDDINLDTGDLLKNVNIILDSYFNEQRVHFQNILNKNTGRHCASLHAFASKFNANSVVSFPSTTTESLDTSTLFQTYPVSTIQSTTTTENIIDYEDNINPTWKPVLDPTKSSCEDLGFEDNSGVYIFEPQLGNSREIFSNKRYCEIRDDGLWTVIQRRDNYTIQHNFNMSWEDYKNGFGDLHKDFWMGNQLLHELSKHEPLILRIELYDFENNSAWAEYSTFRLNDEDSKYTLTVDDYTGNASDSFSAHNGSAFSTFDNTNDQAPQCCPCSVSYGGGWWFNKYEIFVIIFFVTEIHYFQMFRVQLERNLLSNT